MDVHLGPLLPWNCHVSGAGRHSLTGGGTKIERSLLAGMGNRNEVLIVLNPRYPFCQRDTVNWACSPHGNTIPRPKLPVYNANPDLNSNRTLKTAIPSGNDMELPLNNSTACRSLNFGFPSTEPQSPQNITSKKRKHHNSSTT